MALGDIIRKRRKELGMTLDEVAQRIGFSKPYISTVETGKVKNPPSDEFLHNLEPVLGFETGLLIHLAHLQRLPADMRHDYEAAGAENRRIREILRQAADKGMDITALNDMLSGEKISFERAPTTVSAGQFVPVINKASAGRLAEFTDLDYPVGVADDYVRCPGLNDPNAFGIQVDGDSMEPKFYDGDIVIFSPAADVKSGDDCFIRFKEPHESTFKRVFFETDGNVRLQPRNEKYPPIFADGDRINNICKAVARYEQL